MPAKCVSLFLLLAWICAVPEALAKSLADEGALGKPCGGMQHNEEMGVVVVLYGIVFFFSFVYFFLSPKIVHTDPPFFDPPAGGGLQGCGFHHESVVFIRVLLYGFLNSHAVTPTGGPLLVVLCTVIQMCTPSV